MVEFKVDNEIKQEFLCTKQTNTAEYNEFVLIRVDEFEVLADEKIYNMSFSELKELISAQYKNSSIRTLNSIVSILRNYIYFCIQKNIVPHMENRLDLFTMNALKEFVSKNAIKQKYITPEQLKEYQSKLVNFQDKALIECFYWGIRGRTSKEGSLEEIINLKIDKNSELTKNNMLELVKNNGECRIIQISQDFMNLLLLAKEQEEYFINNGKGSVYRNRTVYKINKLDDYVFRIPSSTKVCQFTPNFINGRMARLKEYVQNDYLTINALYTSGMITKGIEIYKKNGVITNEDYKLICKEFDYNPVYFSFVKDMIEQYL